MAKKLRRKNSAEQEQQPEETTLLMPSTPTIKSLYRAKKSAKSRTSEISGEVGQQIAKAVEEKHVDRKALSIACQLADMPDERLVITYFHLLRYMDDLDIVKRAKAQNESELFPEDEGETADDGKVTQIGSAARKVAERAGAEAG